MSAGPTKSEEVRETRKIADLKPSRYGYTVNDQAVDCEPSTEDIARALREGRLETRHYHDETLLPEWKANARSIEEWGRLVRDYHARRIAYLVANKCDDPISVKKSGFITDGNHRIRAVAFRGLTEIQVRVID